VSRDPELEQLLAVAAKVLTDHLAGGSALDISALDGALDESGLSTLGRDTYDMDTSLGWVSETLREVAHVSASVSFALAARYVADRAAVRDDLADPVSGSLSSGVGSGTLISNGGPGPTGAAVVVPWLFRPSAVLVMDSSARTSGWAAPVEDPGHGAGRPRTGLAQAVLRDLAVPPLADRDAAASEAALHEWALLTASVCVGVAEGSLRDAETYAAVRSQFGAPIATFAGLRALMAEMHVRTAAARSLVRAAVESGPGGDASWTALAAAGRAAVDVSLDAVQVHGGYGYTEEYPVAARLRDAISLRARGGGHRAAVAGVATSRLGAGSGGDGAGSAPDRDRHARPGSGPPSRYDQLIFKHKSVRLN
jgi:hypothetical protein